MAEREKNKKNNTSNARNVLEAPNAFQLLVYDSMAFLADHTEARHCRRRLLLLFDVLVKDFRDLARTLLRVSLLSALVVDIGHAETRRIALGPLEIATKNSCQHTYL